MAIELVCSCGRVVRCDQPPAGGQTRCPACGAVVSGAANVPAAAPPAESPARDARKPLWALMGKVPPAAANPPSQPPDRDEPPRDPGDSSPSAPLARDETGVGPRQANAPDAEPPKASSPVRKGLWGVMQSTPPVPAPPAPSKSEIQNPKSEIAVPLVPAAPLESEVNDGTPDAALGAVIGIAPVEPELLSHKHAASVRPGKSQKGLVAASLGGLSVLLSFLSLIDAFWSKIPATLVGFAAILLGMQAASEIQHSAGRQTGRRLVMTAIICGVIGVFLGPLILAGVGRRMWQESTRSLTEGHLQTIGQGLNRYHDKEGVFPPGGVVKPDKDKRQRGFHGWMTLILPYIGEEALFHRIQLDIPYDDKANLPAFEEDVESFFASGTDRAKVHGGLGVSHFAGVGGDVEGQGGEVARAGLFGVNSKVRRQDVSDGLSNTLAAGEIADELPAWGDPENWRTVGKGINRNAHGFGNHDRSGACFLMADGSVRFFSNKTSVRVLTALSTRDGGESSGVTP
jgi:hypothetical protein